MYYKRVIREFFNLAHALEIIEIVNSGVWHVHLESKNRFRSIRSVSKHFKTYKDKENQ